MRLTLNSACCWCIQAYFTAAVAQSTPLPFLLRIDALYLEGIY
jgi:hypothetical protein